MRFVFFLSLIMCLTAPATAKHQPSLYERCLPSAQTQYYKMNAKQALEVIPDCQQALKMATTEFPQNIALTVNLHLSLTRLGYLTHNESLARTHLAKANALSQLEAKDYASMTRTELALSMLNLMVNEDGKAASDLLASARSLADAHPYNLAAQQLLSTIAKQTANSLSQTPANAQKRQALYTDIKQAEMRMMALNPNFGILMNYIALCEASGDPKPALDALRYWVGQGNGPWLNSFSKLSELSYENNDYAQGEQFFDLSVGAAKQGTDWQQTLFPEFPDMPKEDPAGMLSVLGLSAPVSSDKRVMLRAITALHRGNIEQANELDKEIRCHTPLCLQFKRDLAEANHAPDAKAKAEAQLVAYKGHLVFSGDARIPRAERLLRFARELDLPPYVRIMPDTEHKRRKHRRDSEEVPVKIKFKRHEELSAFGEISDVSSTPDIVHVGRGFHVQMNASLLESMVQQAAKAANDKGYSAIMLTGMDLSGHKHHAMVTLHFQLESATQPNIGVKLVPWRWIRAH